MIELHLDDFEQVSLFEHEDERVLILRRRDGAYCFALMYFWHPAEEDEGVEVGWQGERLSGVHDSAESAEHEARITAPWLQNLTI